MQSGPAWSTRATAVLARLDVAEERLCRQFNGVVRRSGACRVFQVASRLGDGVVWYALIALLPLLYGRRGALVALKMLLAGVLGLLLYRALKRTFVRERPFITHATICRAGVPLDRFSFPSGHTLHAVSFTVIAISAFGALAFLLVPLAVLIALSRVVLGLHYPSDVAAGALIGAGLATSILTLFPA